MLYRQTRPHPIIVFVKRHPVMSMIPIFFVAGMAIEWVKINFQVGNVSFYNVWKQKARQRELESLQYQLHLALESYKNSDSVKKGASK